ncbi:hypothetical protein DFJ74DRAFT_694354 [Hyaloraphidium curvatum]|nr:hypothetical protein DFJ74DRAFT_694354 [Hyaloraphidium curvatum]
MLRARPSTSLASRGATPARARRAQPPRPAPPADPRARAARPSRPPIDRAGRGNPPAARRSGPEAAASRCLRRVPPAAECAVKMPRGAGEWVAGTWRRTCASDRGCGGQHVKPAGSGFGTPGRKARAILASRLVCRALSACGGLGRGGLRRHGPDRRTRRLGDAWSHQPPRGAGARPCPEAK